MEEIDVLHVSVLTLLLELLNGLFLVHGWNVDCTLLAHVAVSLHNSNL